jgi:futalosine hydrolase
MRILLVCATETELAPVRLHLQSSVDVLVTGIGMVPMAARCARALAHQVYDLALNIGVCGSFDPAFALGTVVHVVSDCIAELGAEDGESLLTMSEIGLAAESVFFNAAPPDNPVLRDFPQVDAITVNTAHGHGPSIAAVVARLHPQVESMEGAAFMCACLDAGVAFAQVRAVSNVIERRNRGAWQSAEAIETLARATESILVHV